MPIVVGGGGFLTAAYLAMRWSRRPAFAGAPAGAEDPEMAARLDARAAQPRLMARAAAADDKPKGLSPREGLSPPEEPFLQPWQFFLLGGMLAATATVIVATGQSPANIIILSLTVVAVSFVGLGAYRMLAPLVSADVEAPTLIGGRTRIALEREKALVLRSLKELEFDFAMGKMSKADFDEMGGRLRRRAVGLMRQLDAGGGYREQIEKEVAKRLGRRTRCCRRSSGRTVVVERLARSGRRPRVRMRHDERSRRAVLQIVRSEAMRCRRPALQSGVTGRVADRVDRRAGLRASRDARSRAPSPARRCPRRSCPIPR